MKINIRKKLQQYRRVLQISKKPDFKSIKRLIRICGIGFLIIGIIGFMFYLISILFGG